MHNKANCDLSAAGLSANVNMQSIARPNQPPSLTIPIWDKAQFVLSYNIGEVAVFKRHFEALHLRNHYLDLSTDLDDCPPPLERLGLDADIIVTGSHPVSGQLPQLSRHNRSLRYVVKVYRRYHTSLSGDFDNYLGKFSSKSRNTIRRKVRHFCELGNGCKMSLFMMPEEMGEFQRLARLVSVNTYQERLFNAGLPGDVGFCNHLMTLAKSNAVRAYILFLHDQPIAYLCCPVVNGVLLYKFVGYDSKAADLSPGTVLQYLAFKSLFAENRFRAFDFTEGEGEHKKLFATGETLCADVCYFKICPSNWYWIQLHRTFGLASRNATSLVRRVGLKAVLKKFIRKNVAVR